MKRVSVCLWGVFVVSFWTVGGRAEDVVVTDRPDVVESADTVGRHRFQIETSVARETDKDTTGNRTHTFSTPTLFRYGLTENLEMRLEQEGWVRFSDDSGARDSGFSDLSLGLKWHQLDGRGARPSLGWLVHLDVDSGHAAFRGAGDRPSVRVVGEWELPREMSLGVMPGVIYDTDSNRSRFLNVMASTVLGKDWTDTFRSFVELTAAQIATERHGGNVFTFDVGIAHRLAPLTQVDAALSRGINRDAPDFSWTVGLSQKF